MNEVIYVCNCCVGVVCQLKVCEDDEDTGVNPDRCHCDSNDVRWEIQYNDESDLGFGHPEYGEPFEPEPGLIMKVDFLKLIEEIIINELTYQITIVNGALCIETLDLEGRTAFHEIKEEQIKAFLKDYIEKKMAPNLSGIFDYPKPDGKGGYV